MSRTAERVRAREKQPEPEPPIKVRKRKPEPEPEWTDPQFDHLGPKVHEEPE